MCPQSLGSRGGADIKITGDAFFVGVVGVLCLNVSASSRCLVCGCRMRLILQVCSNVFFHMREPNIDVLSLYIREVLGCGDSSHIRTQFG